MRELQRKQKMRQRLYSLPSLIGLFIIAVLLAKGAVGVINKERESVLRSRELEEKATTLVQREEELKEGIARLETEEGIQEEIKERFSVIQEGEFVAVIVDDRRVTSSEDDSGKAWYKKLWSAIMGGK
ncbi:MAG: hypothetical protein COV96_01070 [Candidatus Zambryskibacteria bacterium CG11_big_fil_rev_8_21_14_0_20_42_18]|uniref:Septum formation initiator n=1 Tax=Candidatus Zambryskibacteria bacterium CG_4_9_14_3_um_filter_42_15 TaxID=1975112 RepID=A0A2M7WS58_9BACT|nr:MAG: hypothetical protein COV96_01070 [Candidatus Zambryskibacteria bacterium CG11_big_fil_rev_8_21_14_0_20_42_18]PJA32839.1 MAG: hypothetical protein CO185_01490 [Candidatus Zambryskibacteria bacterium CG_4_9_14_3_um_filter_42_15]